MAEQVLTLKQFKRRVEVDATKNLERALKITQGLLFTEIYRRIVMRTPVDTGRARANWIPTVGLPSDEILDELADVSVTGEPITTRENAKIRSADAQLKALPVGQTAWIVNNLDYVRRLDDGTGSRKAPQGILRVACLDAVTAVKGRTKLFL